MTDKYKDLRDALAAGPTPGPWNRDGYGHIITGRGNTLIVSGVAISGGRNPEAEANTLLIHAAQPETISALLAERDALRSALVELVECRKIKRRIAIEQAAMIPEADEDLHDLDRLMTDLAKRQPKAWDAADAALAQHQGGSNAA